MVNDGLCIVEKIEFFATFLFDRGEVFLMGRTYVGENCYGRLYDVAQCLHLSGLADASFEDANLCLVVHKPYAQWNTNL